MTKIQAPAFLTDVYRDLRDRRLLIPAVVLLVGLVAVPVLLGRSADAPPPPAAPEPSADVNPTEAAVLAEGEVGVRDYRKRLDELKSKNPFKQQFPLPEASSSEDVSVTEVDTTGSGATSPTVDAPAGGSTVADLAAEAPATTAPPSTSGGGGGNGGGASDRPRREVFYYDWRIDVRFGRAGELRERNGVKPLEILPSDSTPVIVFLGASTGGNKAVFAVSPDVTDVTTDGRCTPGPENCRYVILEEGEEADFDYSPNGARYHLSLRQIRLVRIADPSKREPAD